MKCVLLLSLVALCYSVPLSTVSPAVNFGDDGTITIIGAGGRKAVVSRADKSKNVEILLTTPLGFQKLVKADEEKNIGTIKVQDPTTENWNEEVQRYRNIVRPKYFGGASEYDILCEIFRGCQGVLDPTTLGNILIKLEYNVESGNLDPNVYEILRACLENNAAKLERLYSEQDDITPSQVNYYQRSPLLRYLWNKKTAEQEKPYNAWYGTTQEIPQQYRISYGQQQQYQQQLTEPQQQLIQSQAYRSLPWYRVEKPQQWMGPQQYPYEQQRPSLNQYLAKLQLAQVSPWSREFQEQQRPSLDQYLAKLLLAQVLPWNQYQTVQTFPKGNIWQGNMTPLQWRQRDYSLNTPVLPIA
ncbi:hypothetical protein JTB14_002691 [Gonioctena quinquepunctata]|nr:hypothetical protein JTB14_002691 [Gonioctena quinquepunctata]